MLRVDRDELANTSVNVMMGYYVRNNVWNYMRVHNWDDIMMMHVSWTGILSGVW